MDEEKIQADQAWAPDETGAYQSKSGEEKYRLLFENMLEAWAYCRIIYENGQPVDFIYLDVNQAYENVSNLKNVIGKKASELIPGLRENNPEVLETYARVAMTGKPEKFETCVKSFDKHYKVSAYSPERDHFIAMFQDFTEQKKTEAKLCDLYWYNRNLIEVDLNPLVTINPLGKITDINRATVEATGYTRELLIGSDFSDYFTDPQKAREGYLRVLSEGQLRDYPLTIKHRNGKLTPVLYNATVYRNEAGALQGVFASARDITERLKAETLKEQELQKAIILLDLYHNAPHLSDKELYDYALEQAVRITGSEIGFLHLVSDDQQEIMLTAWNKKVLEGCVAVYDNHYPLEQAGNWVDCARAKKPIIYNDFPNSPHQKGLPTGHSPISRFLSAPVIEEDKVRIIFGVGNKAEPYDENDIIQIQLVANELRKILRQRDYEQAMLKAGIYNRSLIEASLDPLITIGPEGQITDANQAMEIATGLTRQQLSGTEFYDYFTDPEKAKAGYLQVYKEGLVRDYELEIKHKDGHILPVLYNATVYRDEEGKVIGAFAAARDITERKKMESELLKSKEELAQRVLERTAELEEQKEELRIIIDSVPALIFYKDRENRFIRINQAFEELTGVPREQLEGKSMFELYPRELAEAYWKDDLEVISTGRGRYDIVEPMETPHGTRIVETDKIPYRNVAGEILGVIGFSRDITEQKKAQDLVRESEEKLRLILNSTANGIYGIDLEGRCTFCNNAALKMLGYQDQEQLLGRNMHRQIHHSYPDGSFFPVEQCRIFQAFATGQGTYSDDEVLWKADGSSFAAEYWSYPQFREGRIAGAVVAFNDITERKLVQEKLKELNNDLGLRNLELESLNKELESFSYSVSHDLRSPLVGIDGFSQLLLRDYGEKLGEQGKNYLERVRNACVRMSDLIDSLLKLSRVSRSDMAHEKVDLSAIAQYVAKDLKTKEPGRKVEFVIAPGAVVEGDKKLLEVVLFNLLSNAWKFTSKHPSARIEFGVLEKGEHPVYFVRDDGSGFDMTYKDQLFSPFRRLHTTREFPGTGIGLSIIQRIMNRHGGRVWAEGEVEKGATFYLEFKEKKGDE